MTPKNTIGANGSLHRIRTKKRGRSIASITTSVAVPFASGIRGVIPRTSFAPVPFDPDIHSVRTSSQGAAPAIVAERAEREVKAQACDDPTRCIAEAQKNHEDRRGQGNLKQKPHSRAVARHGRYPYVVEGMQTWVTAVCSAGPELSNPSASYQTVASNLCHVCPMGSTPIVTDLRHARAASSIRRAS